jgi:hypothetical protein
MSTINDGGPAFPTTWWDRDSVGETVPRESFPGMSLLDYFAGQVMNGMWSNDFGVGTLQEAAARAYDQAEAMLAERERRMKEVPA